MKSLIILVVCTLVAGAAQAVEFHKSTLNGFTDASIVVMAKGCVKTEKNRLGLKKKSKVDCYGVVLKGVAGADLQGRPVDLGNILLMPAGVERAEAEGILDLLIAKNLGRLPQGTTVDVSELRFVDHLAKLSAVTKDPSDTDLIRAGGLTLRISQVQKSDNWTLTSNSTINIGLE